MANPQQALFAVIGTPCWADVAAVQEPSWRRYLHHLPGRAPTLYRRWVAQTNSSLRLAQPQAGILAACRCSLSCLESSGPASPLPCPLAFFCCTHASNPPSTHPCLPECRFAAAGEAAVDLLSRLLAFDPTRRCSPDEALGHEYFSDMMLAPLPSEGRGICLSLCLCFEGRMGRAMDTFRI
jgi:serine/threonine protein kinase